MNCVSIFDIYSVKLFNSNSLNVFPNTSHQFETAPLETSNSTVVRKLWLNAQYSPSSDSYVLVFWDCMVALGKVTAHKQFKRRYDVGCCMAIILTLISRNENSTNSAVHPVQRKSARRLKTEQSSTLKGNTHISS